MKKKIFGLFSFVALVAFSCVALFGVSHIKSVKAEEAAPVLVLEDCEHGKMSVVDRKETYAVGDVVTLEFAPAHFYVLESVALNGEALAKDAEGNFKFAIVSGENKVSATFVVDTALLGEFAGAYESAQAHDWKSLFSLQNVLIFVSFLINSGIAFGLVGIFLKYKKSGSVDRKEVIATIKEVLPSETQKIVSSVATDVLLPMITTMSAHMDDIIDSQKKFIQAYLYQLDGTVESKEKIISLLSGLNLSDANAIDEAKQWFKNEVLRLESKEEEYRNLIAELKESNRKQMEELAILNSAKKEDTTTEKEINKDKELKPYDGTTI